MSGPKCGQVTVVDEAALAAQRRQREEADASELEALENQVRQQAKLDARAERRRVELQQREQRRRDREQAWAREQAEAAERNRQHELTAYNRSREAFEAALGQRIALREEFNGLELPSLPKIAEPDLSNPATVRAAAAAIAAQARQYQRDLDAAMTAWRSNQAALTATDRTREHMLKFQSRAVRSASDVIAALDPQSPALTAVRTGARLMQLTARARQIVSAAANHRAWAMYGELSVNSLAAMDEVLAAEHDSDAKVALLRLEESVAIDTRAAEDAHDAAQRAAEAQTASAERAAVRRRQELVSHEIRDILEDLDYTVSDIEETAFARGGALFAAHRDWPNHAVRFELGNEGQLLVEAVRVADPAAVIGSADQTQEVTEDVQFDQAWCSERELGQFLATARRRGLDARLRAEHAPGTVVLKRVPELTVGKRVRESRKEQAAERKLRQRSKSSP